MSDSQPHAAGRDCPATSRRTRGRWVGRRTRAPASPRGLRRPPSNRPAVCSARAQRPPRPGIRPRWSPAGNPSGMGSIDPPVARVASRKSAASCTCASVSDVAISASPGDFKPRPVRDGVGGVSRCSTPRIADDPRSRVPRPTTTWGCRPRGTPLRRSGSSCSGRGRRRGQCYSSPCPCAQSLHSDTLRAAGTRAETDDFARLGFPEVSFHDRLKRAASCLKIERNLTGSCAVWLQRGS